MAANQDTEIDEDIDNQVIPAVTFLFPIVGGHQQPLSSGHVNSPSQKGQENAELPGRYDDYTP